jgi:hypothetical protein
LENDWLLVVWNKRENKTAFYHIKLLNPDMLVLLTRNHQVKVYSRKINTGFLNNNSSVSFCCVKKRSHIWKAEEKALEGVYANTHI